MEKSESYAVHVQDYSKVTKKEALAYVTELIKSDYITPEYLGEALARLETYFQPAPTPKRNPVDWCTQVLENGRPYTEYGVIIGDVGLCCTDGRRLHILKNFENNKPVVDRKRNWLSLSDIHLEDLGWYPNIKMLLPTTALKEGPLEIIDIDYVKIGSAKVNRKYFNQAIFGMKNYSLRYRDEKSPVYIEDDEKMAIIMPIG